jgi:hypothetical protein
MEDNIVSKYSSLEMSRIIGEPLDPLKPFNEVLLNVADVQTAEPNEYVYYYDVLAETNEVFSLASTGAITTEAITPDSPALFTFVDVATKEFTVSLPQLATSKEAVLARKLATINRSLDLYENKYMFDLMATATSSSGFSHTLTSGTMTFNYKNLIDMIQDIVDYADSYTLYVGSTIDSDMLLWDWNDNKYHSMMEAFKDLGVTKIRMGAGNLSVDAATGARPLTSNIAYLVGTSGVTGKPMLFVRKKLNDIDLLGAAIKSDGTKPQRLVFASPNPIVTAGSSGTRYLAVGLTGYENIVGACVNQYALSKFTRA